MVSQLYQAIKTLYTAASYPSTYGHPDYAPIRKLLEEGYNVNENWDVPKMEGEIHSSGCVIASFTEDDMTVCVTPLFSAVSHGDLKLAGMLLGFGAQTDVRAHDGTTMLHQAVRYCNGDLIQLLLKHGANLEAVIIGTKRSGYTPLHTAVTNASLEMTELLLSERADFRATISQGWNVFDIAILNRQTHMLDFLIKTLPDTEYLLRVLTKSPAADPVSLLEDECNTARHLIRDGIEGGMQEHRYLYLRCLRAVNQRIDKNELARTLIDNVEKMLLSIAKYPQEITWDRQLCEKCSTFQSQDCQTVLDIFLHSPTFPDLFQSAEKGCCLCQILLDALNTPTPAWCSSISEREAHLCDTSTVKLQVKKPSLAHNKYARMELLIGCNGKVSFVKIRQTNGKPQSHLSI